MHQFGHAHSSVDIICFVRESPILSTLTLYILLHVKGSTIVGRQSRFEFTDINGAIAICVEGLESVLDVLLGQYLLVVDSCCVELLEVYLAVSIEVALFEYFDPLGAAELETAYLVFGGLKFCNRKMPIIVGIHLLEGGLKLLEVVPVGFEPNEDAKNHLLKLVSLGKVLNIDQHFLLGFSIHLLVVKLLV